MISNYIEKVFMPSMEKHFGEFLLGLVLFLVGWWAINVLIKLSTVFFRKVFSDSGIVSFLNSLLKFFLRIILLILVMSVMGFNISSIATALGATIVAIGISFKDSISNFMSGIVLITNKPIHVGDVVEFDGFSGKVIKIEMLFTTLFSKEEGKTIIIPNARLVSNTVVRKSDYDVVCSKVNCEISGSELIKEESIRKFLEKEFILRHVILQIPSPKINFERLSENKVNLCLKIYSQTRHTAEVKEEIEKIISKLADKYSMKIEIKN